MPAAAENKGDDLTKMAVSVGRLTVAAAGDPARHDKINLHHSERLLPVNAEEQVHQDNLRLNQIEYLLQRIHPWSMPRCLGIVLGNVCNIDCIHCYQSKNGDNLLRPPEIARALRTELSGLYPFLSTLRLQGGELFAIRGFEDLIEDVAASVRRPIISISTNGTMITEEWAERIVRTPFS